MVVGAHRVAHHPDEERRRAARRPGPPTCPRRRASARPAPGHPAGSGPRHCCSGTRRSCPARAGAPRPGTRSRRAARRRCSPTTRRGRRTGRRRRGSAGRAARPRRMPGDLSPRARTGRTPGTAGPRAGTPRADALVAWLPRAATVRGLVDAAGRDRDRHRGRVVGVREDRVEGLATEPGTPLGAVGVVPQLLLERERAATVGRAPHRARLGAGPHRLRVEAGRELPDPLDAGAAALGEPDPAVVALPPGRAEVLRAPHPRAEPARRRAGVQPRRVGPVSTRQE